MQLVNTRFFLLLLIIGLAGCGLKGPLYLPAEQAAVPAETPGNTAAAAETTEKEKKKKDSDTN